MSIVLSLPNQGHNSGQERFQMNNWLGSLSASTFEYHCILEHCRLDLLWQGWLCGLSLEEIPDQILEDHIRSDPLGQQLVQFGSNLAQIPRALLSDHILRNLFDKLFEVWLWNLRVLSQVWISEAQRLQHHNCLAHVSPSVIRYRQSHIWGQLKVFSRRNFAQNFSHLLIFGRWNSHLQTARF